jgi:hypothetical protein
MEDKNIEKPKKIKHRKLRKRIRSNCQRKGR